MVCAAWLGSQSETSAQAGQRQTLWGHMPPAVRHLPALGRLAGTNRLNLVIGLPLCNQEGLAGLLGQLYDPASPYYHQYLRPADFAKRFGPTQQDYEAVIAFAKANGLRVTGTHANRTLVDISGSAEDIEKTFQVKLHVYRHRSEDRTFYAPDAEPSLDLTVPVLTIGGLDNYTLPHPAGRHGPKSARRPGCDGCRPAVDTNRDGRHRRCPRRRLCAESRAGRGNQRRRRSQGNRSGTAVGGRLTRHSQEFAAHGIAGQSRRA